MDQDGFEITVMSTAGGDLNIKTEHPGSVYDWLLLGGTIASLVPFFIGNVVVFAHRKRRYFQAIGWYLILGNSVAAVIWVGSTFVVNQHFRRVNFLGHCSLWTFWFQLTLGISLWMTFTALRIHHLFSICEDGKPPCTKSLWSLCIPLLIAPAVTFATVATVLHVSDHPHPRSEPSTCHAKESCVIEQRGWRLSSFLVLPPLYFTLVIVQLLRVRKNRDYLLRTQCQHILDNAMMAFVLYLLTGTATYWTNNGQQRYNNIVGRCFLTFSVCSIVFVHFWVHTGWPIYLCLFKRGDEMDKYEENLRRRGAQCLQRSPYEPPGVHDDGNRIDHSWALDGEEAIFQALAAEQTKKDELKMKRDQLRNRLAHLRDKIDELKHQKTVAILPHTSHSMPPVRSLEQDGPHSNPMTRHLSLELSGMSWPTANTMCKYNE